MFEYIPMWRELVAPKDRVTRLLLHTVLENKSMSSLLGRPVGITQAEQIMSAGVNDIDWAGPSGTDDPDDPDGDDAAAPTGGSAPSEPEQSLDSALLPVLRYGRQPCT